MWRKSKRHNQFNFVKKKQNKKLVIQYTIYGDFTAVLIIFLLVKRNEVKVHKCVEDQNLQLVMISYSTVLI